MSEMSKSKDRAITMLQLLCNATGAEFEDEGLAVSIISAELEDYHKEQANEASTSHDKALHIDGVSDVLPLEYDKLPDKLQKELFKRHEHMEIPNGSDCIVYKERDVLELLQMVDRGDYR